MNHIISLILLTLFVVSCDNSTSESSYFIPKAPLYDDKSLWYTDDNGDSIDVFYITPTCIFDWKEESSAKPCHHYDVYGGVMKENFDYSLQLANDIFGEECNFYSPYYRQISLESWTVGEDTINERFATAMHDVEKAFDYYMKHFNEGKKFVLAGYSQGAKAVVELIKGLDKETLSKMKAAYAIGYRITDDDLRNSNVKIAEGETDRGVIISYNSVQSAADAWKAVSMDTRACINPVNWKTDATPADINDSVSVSIDTINKLLLVSGYDGGGIEIPALKGVISNGNYHLSELTLYKENLKENVRKRIRHAEP